MALTSPPHPGFEVRLHGIIRSLTLIPVEGDLVRLDGYTLTVEADAAGRSRWALEQGEAPKGFAPRLLTKQAFEALRDGQLLEGGAISWQSKRWVLQDVWDGARMVARLSEQA